MSVRTYTTKARECGGHTYTYTVEYSLSMKNEEALHIRIGREGETVANAFLKRIGYTIRGCNVRIAHDEIDIVAHDPEDDVIVFVEVKTRSPHHEEYRPELNAHWKKRNNLRRSARRWVAMHEYEGGYRMDLVCVIHNRVVAHHKELTWE